MVIAVYDGLRRCSCDGGSGGSGGGDGGDGSAALSAYSAPPPAMERVGVWSAPS